MESQFRRKSIAGSVHQSFRLRGGLLNRAVSILYMIIQLQYLENQQAFIIYVIQKKQRQESCVSVKIVCRLRIQSQFKRQQTFIYDLLVH